MRKYFRAPRRFVLPQDDLTFWFGESPFENMQKWFMGGPAFDAEIANKFWP